MNNQTINPSRAKLSRKYSHAFNGRKQAGFSMGDFLMWAGVISLIIFFARPFIANGWTVVNAWLVQMQVTNIKSAVADYHSYGNSYAGISIDRLEELELVSESIRTNTYGGINAVTAGTNAATQYTITINGITSQGVGQRLSMRLTGDNDVATFSGDSLSIATTRN